MNYFLVGPDNSLTPLPNCRIDEGKRQVLEIPTLSGPAFAQGRKQPDICVFGLPAGGVPKPPIVIVDEVGMVHQVIGMATEISAGSVVFTGIVEDKYPAPHMAEAKELIRKAME